MAKVNRSLYKIPLVGGIERVPAVCLGVTLAIVLLYSPLYAKIVGSIIVLLIWMVLAKLNSQDAIFLSVLTLYVFQQKYYLAQALETKRKVKNKYKFNP